MARVRNAELFAKAESLRKIGKSYLEISKALSVPKSTLSNWFSMKKWSQSIKFQLTEKNKDRSRNYIIQINKLRRLQTLQRHEKYREEARLEYKKMKADHLFLSGLSIYWGEGEKAGKGRVSVINSSVEMLQVVVNFYRQTLKIPENKLRGAIFIYGDHDVNKALDYWSMKLKVPKAQFIKTQILPTRSNLTKNKVKNGMCNLYFSSTELNIKISEWIKLLALEMRD